MNTYLKNSSINYAFILRRLKKKARRFRLSKITLLAMFFSIILFTRNFTIIGRYLTFLTISERSIEYTKKAKNYP